MFKNFPNLRKNPLKNQKNENKTKLKNLKKFQKSKKITFFSKKSENFENSFLLPKICYSLIFAN